MDQTGMFQTTLNSCRFQFKLDSVLLAVVLNDDPQILRVFLGLFV